MIYGIFLDKIENVQAILLSEIFNLVFIVTFVNWQTAKTSENSQRALPFSDQHT